MKKVAVKLIFSALLVLCTLCLGEFGVRLLPFFSDSFVSSRFRQYDPELGISLIPNIKVLHHRGCFKGKVQINRFGMRDRDRRRAKEPGAFRIALLGDSAVEGVQVRPDEVMNIRMEKLLDQHSPNIEVLNFGLAGIGTTQEYLLYESRVRDFHPDLVVLVFLRSNDVMNNSSIIQPKMYGIQTWYAPYYDLGPGGTLKLRPVEERPFSRARLYLEEHSQLFYYLERMWARVRFRGLLSIDKHLGWRVFSDPLDRDWEDAWTVTEKVLVRLNEAVARDGGKFIILVLPEIFDIDPNWREAMMAGLGEVPPWLEPDKSKQRLRDIAARSGITVQFLSPYMQEYRDQADLQWPYFSFTCDPHYSALGHQVLAPAIVEKLQEHDLLVGPDMTWGFVRPGLRKRLPERLAPLDEVVSASLR